MFLSLLRKVREDLGVTQTQLADLLEATQTFVSKCERGERRLDVIELRQWCTALGIDFGDFAQQLNALSEKPGKRSGAE